MALKKIPVDKLSKSEYQRLINFLKLEIVNRAFWATEQLNFFKDLIESAIDWNYHTKIPNSLLRMATEATTVDEKLPSVEQEEYRQEEDEYIKLKDPFLSRLFLSWVRAIKNKNLHPSNDWFGINRQTDPFFKASNLLEFIEQANTAWVTYFTKENKRFQFRQKYAKLIPEFVGHGYTVGVHTWNTLNEYCDVIAPGTRNFGIYPITDNLANTNICFRYEMKFTDLIDNPEYNPNNDLQKYVKPYDMGNAENYFQGSERKTLNRTAVKRGLVRMHEVKVPSFFLDRDNENDEPIIGKNCYFVLMLDAITAPNMVQDGFNHGMNDFILAAYQDVEDYESGELVATFNDTFPEDFPGKGPLIPFLYDQAHLNYLRQAHIRIVGLLADPPYTEEDLDGVDDEDTDTYEFVPGKAFKNKKVTVLVPGEYVNAIQYIVQAKKIVTEDGEQAQGYSKNLQGMPMPGRRSAEEARTVNDSSSEAVMDVVQQFDDQVLQRSMTIRIRKTQNQLQTEVEVAAKGLTDPEALNKVLESSVLFNRIKDWSGIETMYMNFYEQYQRDLEEEGEIQKQAAQLKMRIDALSQLINTAFEKAAAQGQIVDMASFQSVDQQVQAAQQQRDQMLSQYNFMVGTIQGLKPIPKPSDFLYYTMLIAPITSSDIDVVAGTATVKLKEEKEVTDMLLDYSNKIPEFRAMMDFKKLIGGIAKMVKKKPSEFLKSPADMLKADAEIRQIRQQLLTQMLAPIVQQQVQTQQAQEQPQQ